MSDQGQQPDPSSATLSENIESASQSVRRYSPALFGLIGIAFLLPFISIQCAGKNVVTMKGLDFVVGGEITVDPEFEEAMSFGDDFSDESADSENGPAQELAEDDRVEPNLFAIISLGAALAGLVLALTMRSKGRALFLTVASSLVVLGLIGLRFDASADTGGIPGAIEVKYRFGYWLALLTGGVLAMAHFLEVRQKRDGADTSSPTSPSTPTG